MATPANSADPDGVVTHPPPATDAAVDETAADHVFVSLEAAGAAAAEVEEFDENDADENDADVEEVEPDECCICRDVVELLTQGFLPTCAHKFHFECIVAWANVTNLCPLCKQQFREVTRVDAAGAVVHREPIQDVKQVVRSDPADHDMAAQLALVSDARCTICGRGDDEHVLLLCEARGCPVASHTYCVGLSDVPDRSWYCSRHTSGTRASDFIARPATTLSSRRTTRRLAHLVSNALSGRRAGVPHNSRGRRPAASARVTLDSESGRPIRGIAAAYALRMSHELQQIHRRAELMYARGDHHELALSRAGPSTRELALSRSTVAPTSFVDLLWQDLDASRLEMSGGGGEPVRPTPPSRVSPSLARDYRELAKLMVDAVGSDHYASTVSLVIPKTAKLRLVSRVKTFFARLNPRESVAVLDMGGLEVLSKWIQQPAAANATASPHPQVLEAVLTAVETLPVRQKDLVEVPAFQNALDEIAAMADVGLELRERAIVTSERWRRLNPPPSVPPVQSVHPSPRAQPSGAAAAGARAESASQPASSLPPIRAFSSPKQPVRRPKEKARKQDAWTEPVVAYVKAKLYPLYKHGNGKLSKERFKAIVKQVAGAFKADADAMQSQVVLVNGELSNIAKTRLKTLIDRAYKGSNTAAPAVSAGLLSSVASYSAVPPSSKHRRIS